MEVCLGKHYWRQSLPQTSKLQRSEINRCKGAVDQFQADPASPSLNLERLGSGAQNHWSIRASRGLRVILARERAGEAGEVCAAVNMGHHDAMYAWSRRHRWHTDLDDRSLVHPQHDSVSPGQSAGRGGKPLDDFEEWMLFLSPSQRSLVVRYHSGASRIRGAAGTGKTVVALHRAAELGRRYPDGRILVTTFSRSLCNHMGALYRRLPDPPSNIEFTNVDQIAYRLLTDPPNVDFDKVSEAFETACREVIPGTPLERIDPTYLRDEIGRVIKGRAATRDEYLDTDRFERLGRIRTFSRGDRELCWRLREAWDEALVARGTSTFEDRLILACDVAERRTKPCFRSVIVDEAQDLTLVAMRLVRALVPRDRRSGRLEVDSVLMLDDSAQRIYAGGFRPSWAGLDIGANSLSVTSNYRNARAIFEAAQAIRGDTIIAKEGDDDGAIQDVQFEREQGPKPHFFLVPDGEAPAIRDQVRRLIRDDGFKPEEIGILTQHNEPVNQLVSFLSRQDVESVNLSSLRSEALGPGVRVGTFDRAKGLEFRAVLIARLGQSLFPAASEQQSQSQQRAHTSGEATPGSSPIEAGEVRQLNLDRLFVAMTRARDRLILFADEEPCEEILMVSHLIDFIPPIRSY